MSNIDQHIYCIIYCPVKPRTLISINIFFYRMDVSFQHVYHALICMILTRYINTKLPKSSSECQKLLKVSKIEKRCSKVAEHNLFRSTWKAQE